MAKSREVVITGVGVVCPLGVGKEGYWSALDAGLSGVVELPQLAGSGLPFRIGGRVQGFEGKDFVQPRKTLKVMSHEIQTGYGAAMLAMTDAGLTKGSVDPERLGVVMGSEMLYGEAEELVDCYRHVIVDGKFQYDLWGQHAMRDLFPLWMLKYLPNMAACHIGIAIEARGPNNSIVQGGVSSLLAVMEGTACIERGNADVMLVGGSGSLISMSALPFRGWDQLSKWDGDPALAARPFDLQRDGVVLGEGSGAMIIEAREYAEQRGANILARIRGGSNRFEPVAPGRARTGSAIRSSIEQTIAQANLKPQDIGHVNAHGISTIEDDRLEAQAIHETLGDVLVTAPKSYFGDLGAGSGAVEMIASVLALQHGSVPRTLNYKQPDPECPVNVVCGVSHPSTKPTALLLNQASTGHAAAVLIDVP